MNSDEFERALRRDLPRGQAKPMTTPGKDRGERGRWSQPDEMKDHEWVLSDGLIEDALMLGRRAGRVIGWKDDRHLMLLAGSRSGKGASLIIPNLISYQGSAIVIDPKGENAHRTAARRGKGVDGENGLGQDVHVLDPFGVSGLPSASASFNPLAELNPRSPSVAEDAALFADALITHRSEHDRHWTEAAQAVVRALILFVLNDRVKRRRNLVSVRRLLTLTDRRIGDMVFREHEKTKNKISAEAALLVLLRDQKGKRNGAICAGVAEQLAAMAEKERGSVLSEARTQTQWLDDARMQSVLRRHDFPMADLKRKPATIYLCLPAMRMATHARWLRLIILHALSVMERTELRINTDGNAPAPVLFVLDEFPVLGHMQAIETAAGLMAGFGVKLWVIAQNIGQLKKHYDKGWETFVGNAGMLMAFANNDNDTLTELSKMLGRTDIDDDQPSGAGSDEQRKGTPDSREVRRELPLLAEHELRLYFSTRTNRALLITMENSPAVVERFVYYKKDPLFEGLYNDKPKQRAERRWMVW
jgi:type IV secretion system protein VirD4